MKKYKEIKLNKKVCNLCKFCEMAEEDCWVLCSDEDDRITYVKRKPSHRRKTQLRILNRRGDRL